MGATLQESMQARLRAVSGAQREFGYPLLIVPDAERDLGIEPRRDRGGTLKQSLEQIYAEGLRMGAVQEIPSGENESYVVFSTVAASAHTPFVVEYGPFIEHWDREVGGHPEFKQRDKNEAHVVGSEQGHAKRVASQLVTWVVKKKTVPDQEGGATHELSSVNAFELNSTLLASEEGRRVIREVMKAVNNHTQLHETVLKALISDTIGPQICSLLETHGIKIQAEDFMRIRNVMLVGNYRGNLGIDGKGGGPQSHPTYHKHTVVYPDFDLLEDSAVRSVFIPDFRRRDFETIDRMGQADENALYRAARLLVRNPQTTIPELREAIGAERITQIARQLESTQGWTGEGPKNEDAVIQAFVEQAKRIAEVLEAVSALFQTDGSSSVAGGIRMREENEVRPEDLYKVADPLGDAFFEFNKDWGSRLLAECFGSACGGEIAVAAAGEDIPSSSFAVHPARGWRVDVCIDSMEEVENSVLAFMGKAQALWEDGENAWKCYWLTGDDQELGSLALRQGLSTDALNALRTIKPTNKQLERWLQEEVITSGQRDKLQTLLTTRRSKEYVDKIVKTMEEGTLEERAYAFGRAQVLDGYTDETGAFVPLELNRGYNVPGRASFGVMYEKSAQGYTVTFIPFLSLKGWAEEKVGMMLGRQSGKV